MIATYNDARDEMFGMIYAKWRESVAAVIGYVPEIRWPGKPEPAKPPADKFWSRVSLQLISDRQSSLSDQDGRRRYEAIGILYMQIFCPRSASNALENGLALAQIVRKLFLTHSASDIWFVNPRILEVNSTPESYQVQFAVEYRYESFTTGISTPLEVVESDPLMGAQHFPVEMPDGVRLQFTFPGLPASKNEYVLLWNGLIQDGFAQLNELVTLEVAPKADDQFYARY